MPEISSRVVVHVEALKAEIGWSWIEVQSRLGWSPMQVKNFRDQKRGLADDEYRFLQEVAAAVKAVPQPVSGAEAFAAGMPMMPREPSAPDQNETVTQVRVMTMEDIARKLAEEYVSLAEEPEINGAELAAGRYAISRLALRLGLVDEVKSNVRILNDGNAPALSARPQPFERSAPPPPLSPRGQLLPRPLPAADREEYVPPTARRSEHDTSRVPFGEDGF
jgi:hypothetical protein